MVAMYTTSEWTIADLAGRFGSLPASRICTDVPPGRTIDVFTRPEAPDATLHDSDILTGMAVLPEFQLPVRELFDAAELSDDHPT